MSDARIVFDQTPADQLEMACQLWLSTRLEMRRLQQQLDKQALFLSQTIDRVAASGLPMLISLGTEHYLVSGSETKGFTFQQIFTPNQAIGEGGIPF